MQGWTPDITLLSSLVASFYVTLRILKLYYFAKKPLISNSSNVVQ